MKQMKSQRKIWIKIALAGLAGASVLGSMSPAHELKRRFDIPAGNAVPSLNEWGEQANLNVIGSFDRIREVSTREVRGEFTPQEALKRLIADTGIVCRFTQPGTLW